MLGAIKSVGKRVVKSASFRTRIKQLELQLVGDLSDDSYNDAQYYELSSRLPYIYGTLFLNSILLSWVFWGLGDPLLYLVLPAIICSTCLSRIAYWRSSKACARSSEQKKKDLRRLPLISMCIPALMTWWIAQLYLSGNESQMGIVQYVVAATTFTGILGLAQAPKAAITGAVATVIPSSILFVLSGHPSGVPVSVGLSLTTVMLLLIAFAHHSNFQKLHNARKQLEIGEREAREMATTMHERSIVDPLTGCPNRRAILERIETEISSDRNQQPWLALLDLDGFKFVNDTYGHAEGDVVLKTVAARIAKCDNMLGFGRLGGDEFAILIDGRLDEPSTSKLLTDMVAAIREPIDSTGGTYCVGASIGFQRGDTHNLAECLERADAALYQAKSKTGSVIRFSEQHEASICRQKQISALIQAADLSEKISLAFQPILDLDTDEIISVEVLARWDCPGSLQMLPEVFIAHAEKTGRIRDLTKIVLEKAIREMALWPRGIGIQINLSVQDVLDPTFAEAAMAILQEGSISSEFVTLEVTETSLIGDFNLANQTLTVLRKNGFRVALDDFGTGYSSLSYIQMLPIDQLKIDRSFTANMSKHRKSRALMSAVGLFANQIELECVIEGVETAEQAAMARTLGFRKMQGFYFGKPMSAFDIRLALNNAKPRQLSKRNPVGLRA